jgi:hypothetical protein
MSGKLDDDDRRYLRMAVELSRSYRDDPRRWPFAIYTELGLPAESRLMREDADAEDLRQDALMAVRDWAQRR